MPRRRVGLESQTARDTYFQIPRRPSIFHQAERNAYLEAQEKGEDVPLESGRRYVDDSLLKEFDKKSVFRQDPRDVRMVAGVSLNGDALAPHYQRDWLRVNANGITHDLIHLAALRVLRRRGFISDSIYFQERPQSEYAEMVDYPWSKETRAEEAVVNALEIAGIREGKISHFFWDALEETAKEQNIPTPDIAPEDIALIAQELEYLAVKVLEEDDDEGDGPVYTTLPR